MLPKHLRLNLRKRPDFFSVARSVSTSYFRLFIIAGGPSQAAVVVPKKRVKRAVDRNLIKRKVRAAFQEVLSECNEVQILLVADSKILQISVQKLTELILEAIKRLTKTAKKSAK